LSPTARIVGLVVLLSCAALSPADARAALGSDEASVGVDRILTRAAPVGIAAGERYTVHEMQTPGGTTVREYLSPAGAVFAVAWRGPQPPDLRQILGLHFETYRAAVPSSRFGHNLVLVRHPDIVVESGGRARVFYGRAWTPGLVPSDVRTGEIR